MTVPPEAIKAATEALNRMHADRGWNKPARWWAQEAAAGMLTDAAPLIAAAERDRIRRHAGGLKRTMLRPAADNGPAEGLEFLLWRDLDGLLRGDLS